VGKIVEQGMHGQKERTGGEQEWTAQCLAIQRGFYLALISGWRIRSWLCNMILACENGQQHESRSLDTIELKGPETGLTYERT